MDIMPIDYLAASEKYRPAKIKTLLVGEAPPPSGKTYFYVPSAISRVHIHIDQDSSLPSTIFHHYFQQRPQNTDEYHSFLVRLQEMGVFLIDLHNDNIKVRNSEEGLQSIIEAIPCLRQKMRDRHIVVEDRDITFLLARKSYSSVIRKQFPESRRVPWKQFRITHS
jgi:hypothetical protein